MTIHSYLNKTTKAASLAVFRILFGLLMIISLIRFTSLGWIDKLYISPELFFSYLGFSWVKPLGQWTYLLFAICGFSAIGVTIGYKYRISIIIFFLSFTYIELMDKTTYLNHYYFVSVMAFLMIWLPMHRYYSFDAYRNDNLRAQYIPRWTVDAIKLVLGIVYFYAGLAKINYDWLINALPLKIWLPGSYDLPLIGGLLEQSWMAYAFSWGGMIYDLTIPFLLLWKPTRKVAFFMVIVFHLLTRVLFPIGMFPFIMILSTMIFFDSRVHERILDVCAKIIGKSKNIFDNGSSAIYRIKENRNFSIFIVSIFLVLQLLIPFRYLLYPDNLYWTEEGYRFSWRVMLMEKAGTASFKIVDGETKKRFYVDNRDFLTSFQEKQMATQPDMIIEYAHYLRDHFTNQGHQNIEVYVESYVTLNGALSKRYIDPEVDLTKESDTWRHKEWILDN
ncbi:MAG TPA: HTTM domain-containing protein [Saprospirales bacterium]|nr:HTTM domain-containing protein [Saprospirales bacterium]